MNIDTIRRHHKRKRSTGMLLFDLIIAALILVGIMILTGCGGTFTLRPDGSLSYTTPEILKAPIVEPVK